MQFDPTKLILEDLNKNYIRSKVEQDHDSKCPVDHPIIFIDWNRSITNKGQLNCIHHAWRDPDYWTLDLYCECQSCGASGFTSVIVDEKFSKSGKLGS